MQRVHRQVIYSYSYLCFVYISFGIRKHGPYIPRRYFLTDLDLISARRIRLSLLVMPGTIGNFTLSVARNNERPRVIDSKQVARYGGEVSIGVLF